MKSFQACVFYGAENRDRTYDLRVTSALLYQLSYFGRYNIIIHYFFVFSNKKLQMLPYLLEYFFHIDTYYKSTFKNKKSTGYYFFYYSSILLDVVSILIVFN